MTDQELHDAQLRDLSNYSEAFAEERSLGIDLGKAEGFIEGMKALARKLLMRNRPIQEIVEDTGLTEAEVLQLACV